MSTTNKYTDTQQLILWQCVFKDWLKERWTKGYKINWTAQDWKHWQRWKFRLRSCVFARCLPSFQMNLTPQLSGKGCKPYERFRNTHYRNLKKNELLAREEVYQRRKSKTCVVTPPHAYICPVTKTILYTWLMLQRTIVTYCRVRLVSRIVVLGDLLHALSGTSALSVP
jgi:hypothetical protein